jgi:LacI family transcriptional regulator
MTVSIREVAAAASVSVGTVSNVLNRPEIVSPATVAQVHAVISSLGFIRNEAARQLRAGKSRSIGMLVLDIGNPFFTDVARGAEDRAAAAGMTLLLGNSGTSVQRELSYLELFEEQRVHGLLVTPVGDDLTFLDRIRSYGTPVVLVDRATDRKDLSSVSVDDVAGGFLAAQHLLSTGRRRLSFVGGPGSIHQVADRLAGARKAVAGQPGATLEYVSTESMSVVQGRMAGKAILARKRRDRPDAVFAANDLLAMGVLQGLVMHGNIRVPEDIALIGYDDIDFASAAVVPLSSIRQPSEHIGYVGVDLLMREAADGTGFQHEHVVLQPELVVRGSTVA